MSAAKVQPDQPEAVVLTWMQLLDIMVFEMHLSHEDVEQFWFFVKREMARQEAKAANA
jgi:hypothetical protein